MKTTAILATGVDRVELVEAQVPDPGPGEVLIASLYTSVSPGTELRCLGGRQPGLTFPFVPGYSTVGRVVAKGRDVSLAEGTLVFCQGTEKADLPLAWGGHLGHVLRNEALAFPVPDGVDPVSASLAKMSAIAYRGVRLAKALPHEQVAVVGLGPIGQLSSRLFRLSGARVLAADLLEGRVARARAAGVEAFVPDGDLVAAFAMRQPAGAGVVVDCTGAPGLLQRTAQLARLKPWDDTLTEQTRLVLQGSYPGDVVFDYHVGFARELAVLLPRDCQPRDLRAVLGFLRNGSLKVRDLVSRISRPKDAQGVFLDLRAGKPELVTAVFAWNEAPLDPIA